MGRHEPQFDEENLPMWRASVARAVRPLACALFLASLMLAPAAPAFAHHECDGVPNCVSVSSGTIELRRSGSATRELTCPSSAQYPWAASWDKSSSAVTVVAVQWGYRVTYTATNWSPTSRHTVEFYLGCSATQQSAGRSLTLE
jgi:hypothetical protein